MSLCAFFRNRRFAAPSSFPCSTTITPAAMRLLSGGNTMSRNLFLKAALPLALVCGPLAAQDVMELHGYMRSGVGRSSNGGEQVSFFLANTGGSPTGGPGYRLGNETDNYLELAFDIRAYEKAGTAFKLHFRPAFRQYNQTRDASADAGGQIDGSMAANANQQIWIREAWGEATGVFGNSGAFKDSTLWVGRRFYNRQDLHMRDEWYWNNSGDGVGIENIDLGGAKMSYAYVQHDTGNMNGNAWNNGAPAGALNAFSPWAGGGGKAIVGSHDLRFSDIKMPWEGGSLILGVQYNEPRVNSGYENSGNNNKGTQYNLILNQANVMGGDNRVYATYGNGSTFWNWYNPEIKTENTWYQVMDIVYLKLAKSLEMQGTLIYRKQTDVTGKGANSNTWTSAGVRPVYFLTKHFSVAAEVGYDKLQFEKETDDRHLLKKTIALQWQPQSSFWSRPSIRLFVTQANWNKNADQWNIVGGGSFGGVTAGNQAVQTQGLTYGAQIEAWW
jgi:maltoporin